MNWLLPFLAAGLVASCHPAHAVAVVAAHPVRRSNPCDAQPQHATCKR